MTAISLFGYWRTLSDLYDCRPTKRMTRLTTVATTGRRMKRSVNFMPLLGFRWLGIQLIAGLNRVIDLDGETFLQAEDTVGGDFVARLEPREDGDLIATG